MRGDLTRENEIKVFILHLMGQVGHGLCYDDIANMTYESGYVGYFDFADIFSKLIDSANVEKSEPDLYAITARGRAIAENLGHLILPASKAKGTAVAARYTDLKKSGAQISHSTKEEAGGYRFECSIREKERDVLRISLFVKDKTTAGSISGKFGENPSAAYRGIYAMLTGDADFLF
ncbi:MAG: DUF4364 family protein [Oscillospiraceae bacterium]|nr:DUF4364 family protein [Oscillospiraceae bacterium]